MLSYKHGFHAGNFADVLKHICWIGAISHLLKKNKPFSLYDTHSGAGQYHLDSDDAMKTQEFQSGVARLVTAQSDNSLLSRYLELVRRYYTDHVYAGSPLVAANLLREEDSLSLFELHPNEYRELKSHLATFPQAAIHHRDGYEGLLALTPPPNQRGAVLIDPPYEQVKEYQQVISTVNALFRRWKNANVLIWYPKLSSRAGDKAGAAERMVHTLGELNVPVFTVELCITQNTPDAGMYGCGMCVMNPPWQYDLDVSNAIDACLPLLGPEATVHSQWINQPD